MCLLSLPPLFLLYLLQPGPQAEGGFTPEGLSQVSPWAGEAGISPPDAYPLLDQVLEGCISWRLTRKLKLDGQAISAYQFPENVIIDPTEAAAVRMPPCAGLIAFLDVVPGFGIIGTAWGRATIECSFKVYRLALAKLAASCLCSLDHS